MRAGADALKTFRITATNPPGIIDGWTVFPMNGCGTPWVTSTDGTNNMIVWTVGTSSDNTGSDGDQRLHGYDGDTGAVVYGGGGANELMAGMHKWRNTGIVARGRIYVAGDNKVYAFKLPGGTPTPTPTATPTLCVVPNFIGTKIKNAPSKWVNRGFQRDNLTTEGLKTEVTTYQSLPARSQADCSTATILVSSRR